MRPPCVYWLEFTPLSRTRYGSDLLSDGLHAVKFSVRLLKVMRLMRSFTPAGSSSLAGTMKSKLDSFTTVPDHGIVSEPESPWVLPKNMESPTLTGRYATATPLVQVSK